MTRSLLYLLTVAGSAVPPVQSFCSVTPSLQPSIRWVVDRDSPSCLLMSSTPTSSEEQHDKNDSMTMISNEFSRTIPPERIKARTHASSRQSSRDYQMSISATSEECEALAKRFDLKHIESLEANVAIRSELGATNGGVEVEGNVVAVVTQTCVRTNEDFLLRLEFPLYSIVRPVIPFMESGGSFSFDDEESLFSDHRDSGDTRQRRSGNDGYARGSTLEDLDSFELQRMLQDDLALGDDGDDSALMEDEAIFPKGGSIDIGELVAQLFWLSLDPYPKKPGTDLIQTTISG